MLPPEAQQWRTFEQEAYAAYRRLAERLPHAERQQLIAVTDGKNEVAIERERTMIRLVCETLYAAGQLPVWQTLYRRLVEELDIGHELYGFPPYEQGQELIAAGLLLGAEGAA